jgi:hypothetical protein
VTKFLLCMVFVVAVMLSLDSFSPWASTSWADESNICEAATLSEDFDLHISFLKYQTPFDEMWLRVDFEYVASATEDILFRVSDFAIIESATLGSDCEAATLSEDFDLHIPLLNYQDPFIELSLWVDLEYVPSSGGDLLFKVINYGVIEPGLTLSAAQLAPGQFLTIKHESIKEGDEVEVTFKGPGGYVVTAKTSLTKNGAAKIAVPPFINTDTFDFTSGDVTVSIAGVNAKQPLTINELPQVVDTVPGEITRLLINFSIENYQAAQQKIGSLSGQTGADVSALVSSINEQIAVLQAMGNELATQQLTLGVNTGSVVMDQDELRLLDRVLAAHLMGAAAEAETSQSALASTPARIMAAPSITRQDFANILKTIKTQAIPGIQVMGSYVSVVAGTTALIAVVIPGGQPLAGAAAKTSIFSTAVITSGTAFVSFVTDLSIDWVEGNEVDWDKAASNSERVFVNGFVSISLTAAGGIKWAGATLGSIASWVHGTVSGILGLRDLK